MIYTYVIFDKLSFLFKIGKSKNITRRLKQFKTSNLNLELVLCIIGNEEKFLHTYFKNKRIGGEWFKLDYNDLKDLRDFKFEKYKEIIAG